MTLNNDERQRGGQIKAKTLSDDDGEHANRGRRSTAVDCICAKAIVKCFDARYCSIIIAHHTDSIRGAYIPFIAYDGEHNIIGHR